MDLVVQVSDGNSRAAGTWDWGGGRGPGIHLAGLSVSSSQAWGCQMGVWELVREEGGLGVPHLDVTPRACFMFS